MKTKKIQLENGLKVLLLQSQKAPVVSIQMWVKTGSADEKKNEEGLSHFIEHLVFKGTRKFKMGEIAKSVESSGGEINAYTSFDQTVFYVTISKNFTDVGLEVISEMMGFPSFESSEIDAEREVVLEEIKMGQDSPERKAGQGLFQTLYKKHPYGRPVIGYPGVIKKVSPKKIRDYFQKRYVPKNMFLVVSGDFEYKEMEQKVRRNFEDFKKFKLEKRVRSKEPPQTKSRLSVKSENFEKTFLYLAWPAPSVKHKDVPALDVLGMVFGQGDSSRLARALRLDEALVQGVGSSAFTPQDPGFFAISMTLNSDNLSRSLDKVIEELKGILMEPPTADELGRAITNLTSEQIYSLDTVDGLARKAGSFEFYTGDHNYYKTYTKQIADLQPGDILRVARKYLTPSTLNVFIQGKGDQNKFEKAAKDFKNIFNKAYFEANEYKLISSLDRSRQKNLALEKLRKIKFRDSKVQRTKIERIDLSNGVRLLGLIQRETPTCSLRFGYLGGSRLDPKGSSGSTELLSRIWTSGTKRRAEFEINEMVESMAAGISAFGGRNTQGLSLDFLNPFSEDMLQLGVEILTEPAFLSEHFEREKSVQIHQIKMRLDQPSSVCSLQFAKAIFGNHPYARDSLGTLEDLESLSVQTLREMHKKTCTTRGLVVSAVGDLDIHRLGKTLEKIKMPGQVDLIPEFSMSDLKENLVIKHKMKKEQNHILFGYKGLELHDSRRHAINLMASILSGQGGRLFVELRDKNSLAYSVAPTHMEGLGGGYFAAYIACTPDKTSKAIQMIQGEFIKLMENKVSEEELTRAQRYLVGRHDIDLQRKSSLSMGLLLDTLYGLNPEENLNIAEKYFSVTAEDIRNLAQDLFSKPHVLSIVGEF